MAGQRLGDLGEDIRKLRIPFQAKESSIFLCLSHRLANTGWPSLSRAQAQGLSVPGGGPMASWALLAQPGQQVLVRQKSSLVTGTVWEGASCFCPLSPHAVGGPGERHLLSLLCFSLESNSRAGSRDPHLLWSSSSPVPAPPGHHRTGPAWEHEDTHPLFLKPCWSLV